MHGCSSCTGASSPIQRLLGISKLSCVCECKFVYALNWVDTPSRVSLTLCAEWGLQAPCELVYDKQYRKWMNGFSVNFRGRSTCILPKISHHLTAMAGVVQT